MLRAVVLTQYWRVTDRRTDGRTEAIAVASTALAMRALRHAVKIVLAAKTFISFQTWFHVKIKH